MIDLLDNREQENIVKLIVSSRLCDSNEKRRAFLRIITLRVEDYYVEIEENPFLVNLIHQLVQAGNEKVLRLIIKTLSPLCDSQKLRYLENKLNSISYIPSQPTAKPAYFVDEQVFQLMPLDIGTIWGLQRSSFIGLLIGFEQTEIYENFKNVEFALSQAIEVNQKANESATKLPKREWMRLDINRHPGAPWQKAQIIDAVVDISNEVANSLENNSFPDSSIPGFFFEIDAKQLHTSSYEQIKNWCNTLLNQLFNSNSVAIIINIIRSLDEDVEGSVKTLKTQLGEIAKEIPIELMRLDPRLFFDNNISSQKTDRTNFINIEWKPGLPFCRWMYHAVTRSYQRKKLEKERQKYIHIIDLYRNLKEQYSEKELQDTYSGITARDVVLDIKAIATTSLKELYYELLKIIVDLFPQWSYEWIRVYADSEIEEAVRAALSIAAHVGCYLSDILMDAWVDGINIDTLAPDSLDKSGAIALDLYNLNKIELEVLFLALLRKEQERSDQIIQAILQKLAIRSPDLQVLYHFYQNQKEQEDDFINQSYADKFTLAIRAKLKFKRVINKFQSAQFSHITPTICWLLAVIPPNQKNITELLLLEQKKRAVFGLCTPKEWEEIKKRQERERQVLDCRRNRHLIYSN
ncbi:hypothetical protein [Limnofasciculus baicalensis]|uniref:Uncharacterized protein n=1 Tax=Limnofasciculus baicalensis BBK-W-15 TaxID=2699891 RepID=A0AAE3GRI9_9CYAN|nr:hypothetical protein [Limnofasciculus baicalensis]MCP2728538.1 hypothetical protein [Limnofasciculus baicalensis BBK-W-15]